MLNLIEAVRTAQAIHPVSSFKWTLDKGSCPIHIPDLDSSFEENVYLKEHLHTVLNQDMTLNSHYWVIQNWGGIKSFKKNDRNDALINGLFPQLNRGTLRRNEMGAIASLSKLASFHDYKHYAIYDSRVIYALNWLIFKHSADKSLFPQPQGRGASVSLNTETLYELSKVSYTTRSYKVAYHEYCALMKVLAREIFGDEDKPYLPEMLLFSLAYEIIPQDIRNTVEIRVSGMTST